MAGPDNGWVPYSDTTYVSQLGDLFTREGTDGTELGLRTDDRHRNLSGKVHGGVLMTLFDRSAGLASRALLRGGRVATASMTVNFSRPVATGDFIEVSCRLRKVGRTALFVDCDAHVKGKLVGTATGIMMRVSAPSDVTADGKTR